MKAAGDTSGWLGTKAAAQAEQAKLLAARMPVRLVDSLGTDVLSDENGGFWVLLQDGFGRAARRFDARLGVETDLDKNVRVEEFLDRRGVAGRGRVVDGLGQVLR